MESPLALKAVLYSKERKITLDEVAQGLADVQQRNTVGDMIEQLSDTYQLNRKEAEVVIAAISKNAGRKALYRFCLGRGEGTA